MEEQTVMVATAAGYGSSSAAAGSTSQTTTSTTLVGAPTANGDTSTTSSHYTSTQYHYSPSTRSTPPATIATSSSTPSSDTLTPMTTASGSPASESRTTASSTAQTPSCGASYNGPSRTRTTQNTGNQIKVPLNSEGYVVYGTFDVSQSKGLSLVIATNYEQLLLGPGKYAPNPNGTTLPKGMAVSGGGNFVGERVSTDFTFQWQKDTMSGKGFSIAQQDLGAQMQGPSKMFKFPLDGMLGLSESSSASTNNFVASLCRQNTLQSCKFGLALCAQGGGSLILGETDTNSIDGTGTTFDVGEDTLSWSITGTVVRPADGTQTTVAAQTFYPASEAFNIIGPTDQVLEIFESLGITPETSGTGQEYTQHYATYDCEKAPPDFAFAFGSDGTQWTFDPTAWKLTRTDEGCTLPIVGWDWISPDTWLLGQVWLRGKYVEFDLERRTMMVAKLKAGAESDRCSDSATPSSIPSTSFTDTSTSTIINTPLSSNSTATPGTSTRTANYTSSDQTSPTSTVSSVSSSSNPTTGQSSGEQITSLLYTREDAVVGTFNVGGEPYLFLVVATYHPDTLINYGVWQPQTGEQDPTIGKPLSGGEYTPVGRQIESTYIFEQRKTEMTNAKYVGVKDQLIGTLMKPNPRTPFEFPQQGIVGLMDSSSKSERSFAATLYQQHKIQRCGFGIALDLGGLGTITFGDLNKEYIGEVQTKIKTMSNTPSWIIEGSVVYPAAGLSKTITNQRFNLASEVFNIIGPYNLVKEILEDMGMTTVPTGDQNGLRMIYGNFLCDDPIPEFGFSFGSTQSWWPLDVSTWKLSQSGINCTAPIVGWDWLEKPYHTDEWYVGQTWFRGKYVDFNLENQEITIANIQGNGGASSMCCASPTTTTATPGTSTTLTATTTSSSTSLAASATATGTTPDNEDGGSGTWIPLRADSSHWTANIRVGNSPSVPLLIDTTSPDLIVYPMLFDPSCTTIRNGSVQGAVTPNEPCMNSSWHYDLYTDVLQAQNLVISMQQMVHRTDVGSGFNFTTTDISGSLGLSGYGQNSTLFGSKSLIDNLCVQPAVDQCRFGIAMNATTGASDSGNGTLILGAVDKLLIDGELNKFPIDPSRKDRTITYVGNDGQWWLKGDVKATKANKTVVGLTDQSFYLSSSLPGVGCQSSTLFRG